jgi:hypothetical protein
VQSIRCLARAHGRAALSECTRADARRWSRRSPP